MQLFELLQIDASRVLLAALLDNQECRAAESGRELNAIRASLTCEVLLRNNLAQTVQEKSLALRCTRSGEHRRDRATLNIHMHLGRD